MAQAKLKKGDLKVGMRVTHEQLEDIYGLWIFFDNYHAKSGGNIICISDESSNDKIRDAIKKNGGRISTFYQDPDMESDEVAYYE